ncbi:MAG TPA: alcohol dehydrogenase catalytic domain-containing protein [Ktedonobacteraceae bacterium]|nr:alcohol dehydrogenase catalytic domain-containing protein [Ktedonobacteraceae bacterium]
MWTSILEIDLAHVIPAKILGLVWRGAYFSSFAPLQVQNLPRQTLPASNWVRVRNLLAGICGSDLPLIFANGDFRIAPAAIPGHVRSYPGHEVVGEVIEVGDDVQHLHVGDRVVLQHGPNCITAGIQQVCRSCASGNYGLCEYGVLPGPQPVGGGWSEEMLLHEQQLFRVPPGISDMQAVLLEPSAVAVHAVLRHVPQPQDRILIIGAGTIGLLILEVVRALAPDAEVCVMARHAFQVERAARMGAQIIYPQDSYREVQRATGAQLYQGMLGNQMLLGGYDVIYDTVGSKRTTQDSLRWARAGATVVMVGVNLHRMKIDLTPIWYQEINLIGTLGNGIESWPIGTSEKKSSFEIAAEMIENRRIFPDKLITHSFSLSGYRDALLTAVDKGRNRAIKVIFDYSKQPPSVVPNVRASGRQRQRVLTSPPGAHLSQPLIPAPKEQESRYPEEDMSFPIDEEAETGTVHAIATPIDDDATIVVSTSKFAWFNGGTDYTAPTPSDEEETAYPHDEQDIGYPQDVQETAYPHDEQETAYPQGAPLPWTGTAPAPSDVHDAGDHFAAPIGKDEDEDATKTVVVSPPRRGRTRRKTGTTRPTHSDEGTPIETTDPSSTLSDVREPFPAPEQEENNEQ